MDRLATFRRFIAARPDDPFPRYGLAMELRGQGLVPEALAAFAELRAACPDYVPTYLMYGTTLLQAGDRPAAREVLTAGCETARKKGDRHALGELETALASADDGA